MKKTPRKNRSRFQTRQSKSRGQNPKKMGRPRVQTRTKGRKRHAGTRRTIATSADSRVAYAVRLMRQRNASLARASRIAGLSPRTVRRLAGSALRKNPNGRYSVQQHDRLARIVRIPATDGIRDVTLRNSKDARRLGEYWNAVHAYLAKGDASRLNDFRGQHITTIDGERIPLLTDRASLDVLGSAGVLSFESMYAKAV